MTTAELADRLRTPEGTLRYWRARGFGPRGVRFGRRVLYPLAAVEAFEADHGVPVPAGR